jgi:putative ABC transport system permease protein
LLAGAGLFVRSLQKLRETDLGFQSKRLVGFSLEFGRGYDARRRAAIHKEVLTVLRALPEVRDATVSGAGLFSGDGFGIKIAIDGYATAPGENLRSLVVVAGPRFFDTLGIPILSGRGITADDEAAHGPPIPGRPRVVVISETVARNLFRDTNPLGKTLRFGADANQPPLEVIGIAKDIKYRNVWEKPENVIYVPYFGGVMHFPMIVRVALREEIGALGTKAQSVVQRIDPRVKITGLRPMDDVVNESLMRERLIAQLAGFFSAFAVLLASLGLYGMLSFGVAQRTREIGVRIALGARPGDVSWLIVGQGLRLAILGAAVGVALAIATMQLAAKMLYGVTPSDPVTLGGVSLLLLLVALVAAWLPARRAAKMDPIVALRAE